MRVRDVRRAISAIVLAATGCTASDTCFDTDDRTFEVATPSEDPPTQLLLQSCQIDADACPDLCQGVLTNFHISGTVTGCDVDFHTNAAIIHVAWEVYVGGRDCPVAID
jgi:hypothetical protein